MLPVKEVGEILYKSLITEEVHETAHDDGSKLKRALDSYHGPGHSGFLYLSGADTYRIVSIHYSDHIPSLYTPEILTPPPNLYC